MQMIVSMTNDIDFGEIMVRDVAIQVCMRPERDTSLAEIRVSKGDSSARWEVRLGQGEDLAHVIRTTLGPALRDFINTPSLPDDDDEAGEAFSSQGVWQMPAPPTPLGRTLMTLGPLGRLFGGAEVRACAGPW